MSEATKSYAAMEAGEFLSALGDDAQKWAEAFCEQYPDMDREIMFGWFANAIEHSGDVRRGRLVRNEVRWNDYRAEVERERRFWKELVS
jgi:hypothetical protein